MKEKNYNQHYTSILGMPASANFGCHILLLSILNQVSKCIHYNNYYNFTVEDLQLTINSDICSQHKGVMSLPPKISC